MVLFCFLLFLCCGILINYRYLGFSHSNVVLSLEILENGNIKNGKASCCIVGSGPGGMYMVQFLLKKMRDQIATIDVYDRLPFPFGLVRYGVGLCVSFSLFYYISFYFIFLVLSIAPDHPEVKVYSLLFILSPFYESTGGCEQF